MHTLTYTRTSMYRFALVSCYKPPRIRSMKIRADIKVVRSCNRCGASHTHTHTHTRPTRYHTPDTVQHTLHTAIYTTHSIHNTPYTVHHTDTHTRYTTYLDPTIDTAFNHLQTTPAASFPLHANLGQTHWADARVRGGNRGGGWLCAGGFSL
jgi:hypothetical protein